MPKPPNIIRPTSLKTSIPADLRGWLDLHLYSDSQQRVPHGAYQALIVKLLREYKSRFDKLQEASQ